MWANQPSQLMMKNIYKNQHMYENTVKHLQLKPFKCEVKFAHEGNLAQ